VCKKCNRTQIVQRKVIATKDHAYNSPTFNVQEATAQLKWLVYYLNSPA